MARKQTREARREAMIQRVARVLSPSGDPRFLALAREVYGYSTVAQILVGLRELGQT